MDKENKNKPTPSIDELNDLMTLVAMKSVGKNFKLNYEGFEEFMIDGEPNERLGGAHYIFKFPNGYGASVIKHIGSYGFRQDLWELAAIKFYGLTERMHDPDGWHLWYIEKLDLCIEGYLTDERVRKLLGDIKNYEGGN